MLFLDPFQSQIAQFRGQIFKGFPFLSKLLRSLRGDACQTNKHLKKVIKVGKNIIFWNGGGGEGGMISRQKKTENISCCILSTYIFSEEKYHVIYLPLIFAARKIYLVWCTAISCHLFAIFLPSCLIYPSFYPAVLSIHLPVLLSIFLPSCLLVHLPSKFSGLSSSPAVFLSIFLSSCFLVHLPTQLYSFPLFFLAVFLSIFVSSCLVCPSSFPAVLSIQLPSQLSCYTSSFPAVFLSIFLPICLTIFLPSCLLVNFLPSCILVLLSSWLSSRPSSFPVVESIFVASYLLVYLLSHVSSCLDLSS